MRQRENIKVAYFFVFFFGCQVVTFGFCLRTRITLLAIPCGNLWNSVCWPSERLQYVGTAGISLPCSAFGVPPMGSCFSRFYICRLFLDLCCPPTMCFGGGGCPDWIADPSTTRSFDYYYSLLLPLGAVPDLTSWNSLSFHVFLVFVSGLVCRKKKERCCRVSRGAGNFGQVPPSSKVWLFFFFSPIE